MNENFFLVEQAATFRLKQLKSEAERARAVEQTKQHKRSLKRAVGKRLVSLGQKLMNQPQRA
jgi:hypothetical protein